MTTVSVAEARSKPNTVSITEAWLARLVDSDALPDDAAHDYFWETDKGLKGFAVRLGKRFATFVVQHRVNGKQVTTTIGRYRQLGAGKDGSEIWTVERAHDEARRILGGMSLGIDPRIGDREKRGIPTLDDLYIVAGLWTRRIKIGRTANLIERIASLQSCSGEELVLYLFVKGAGPLEKGLHACFDRYRLHGEWFDSSLTALLATYVPMTGGRQSNSGFLTWVQHRQRQENQEKLKQQRVPNREYVKDPRTIEPAAHARLPGSTTWLWRGRERAV